MKTLLLFLLPSLLLAATPDAKILKTVKANLGIFNKCYADSGEKQKGTVVVDWTIDDHGKVVKAKASIKSTIRNIGLHLCIVDRLKAIKFPPAPKGTTSVGTYTFDF